MSRRQSILPLLLGAALIGAPIGTVQAQSISIGIMGGGSLSTFTGDFTSDVKNYATWIAGAFAHIGVAGFAVHPGIYYTQKGFKTTTNFGGSTTGEEEHHSLNYIQIPLVARLTLGPIYVGGGPAIGFKIGCHLGSTSSAGDCGNFTGPDPKATEISGIAEAGLALGKFSLGLRADLGLSNVFSGPINDVNVRTRTVSAVAELRF
jgi:hypothetical protein